MFRFLAIAILSCCGLWSPSAFAGPNLDPYALTMAQSMKQVIDGAPFDTAFPWPMEKTTPAWDTDFRKRLKALGPYTLRTAAIALNWTFFKAGQPIYAIQVVIMPIATSPAIIRLQRLWKAGETAYPEWMVSTQGRPPNEWPDRFLPWAKVLAAFQKSAMPNECKSLPLADATVVDNWIPKPYRANQNATLRGLVPLRKELCKFAYDADSVTMMPVQQHFNLVGESGQILGGIRIDFKAGPKGLVANTPQFKQIGVPE